MGRYIPTGIYWDSRLIKSSITQGEQRRTPRETICVGFSNTGPFNVTEGYATTRRHSCSLEEGAGRPSPPSPTPKLACGVFLKSPPAFRNAKGPRFPIFNPFTASWRRLHDLIPLDS